METITSKDNKTISKITKLIKDSKHRKKEGLFTIEGFRLCDEAIKSKYEIENCLFSLEALNKNKEKIDEYISCAKSSFCCDNSIFSGISDTKTPQGVLFVLKSLDNDPKIDKINENGLVLVLDCIQDPSNMGTILRSACAFKVNKVVLSSDCVDIYSPKVLRGSMGAIFKLDMQIVDDLPSFIKGYTGKSFAAVLDKDSITLDKAEFSNDSLIVIGNEGNGIRESVIDSCDEKLFIKMDDNTESLNASVAASIILYEASKNIF